MYHCSCTVKLSNDHLFQKKKKKEAEAEISEVASNATEEDQVIVLRPLNMEDMKDAKNKVC